MIRVSHLCSCVICCKCDIATTKGVRVHNRKANSPAFRLFCLLQDYNMDLHNSILEALTPIKQTFKKSKRLSKTLLEAATCFMCLAFEARPSFLYDQGRISVETALQVAQNLSSVSDAFHDIVVLEYAQDILFAKLGLLLTHLQNDKIIFIDVGKEKPGIVSGSSHVKYLQDVCKGWVNETNYTELRLRPLRITDHEDLSGPTIIGLLLGYPVVYFLQKDMNMLGNVPLLVTTCKCTSRNFITNICSFSIPNECVNSEATALLSAWKAMFVEAISASQETISISQTIELHPVLVL